MPCLYSPQHQPIISDFQNKILLAGLTFLTWYIILYYIILYYKITPILIYYHLFIDVLIGLLIYLKN